MKKYFIITTFFLLSACSLNKVVHHHGVHNLEKKQAKLKINSTNKNDIIKLIGPPSTKSTFDNDIEIRGIDGYVNFEPGYTTQKFGNEILSYDSFIIPDYKIDLFNKSKKLIKSIDNFNNVKIKVKEKKIKTKDTKQTKKSKTATKKIKTKKTLRTLWVRRKKN